MAAKLILAPEAEQDIGEAYAWYEDQRYGLGEEFLSCVEACLEAIRRMPEMHGIIHENYRRGLVRRFPYGIFYDCPVKSRSLWCRRPVCNRIYAGETPAPQDMPSLDA